LQDLKAGDNIMRLFAMQANKQFMCWRLLLAVLVFSQLPVWSTHAGEELFGSNFYRPAQGSALQYKMFVENIRPEVYFIDQEQVNEIVNSSDEERLFQAFKYKESIQVIRGCPAVAQAIFDAGAQPKAKSLSRAKSKKRRSTAGLSENTALVPEATARKLSAALTEGAKDLDFWNFETRFVNLETCLRTVGELSDFMTVTGQPKSINPKLIKEVLQQLSDYKIRNYPRSEESKDI
jgi:hypothetical protein